MNPQAILTALRAALPDGDDARPVETLGELRAELDRVQRSLLVHRAMLREDLIRLHHTHEQDRAVDQAEYLVRVAAVAAAEQALAEAKGAAEEVGLRMAYAKVALVEAVDRVRRKLLRTADGRLAALLDRIAVAIAEHQADPATLAALGALRAEVVDAQLAPLDPDAVAARVAEFERRLAGIATGSTTDTPGTTPPGALRSVADAVADLLRGK